jgi:hypothetical protein
MIATETNEGLAESAQNPGVLGALISRNDVTVGLEKHPLESLLFGLTALCHKVRAHSNIRSD